MLFGDTDDVEINEHCVVAVTDAYVVTLLENTHVIMLLGETLS